ncbi:gag-pol polyprotein [Hordeum vulgare]|nr:gag-pol polyprotein [Hordeum vulgare]
MDDPSIFRTIPRKMAEHGNFPSVMEESDDVPSSDFINDDGDKTVEHETFPSTTAAFGDELRDFFHHIESVSPIYNDVPILDKFVLPLDKTMAIVDDDAPPTWFHHDEDDHELVYATSPTPHEWIEKGKIGEGDVLLPLVDYVDIDCVHDDDSPIAMSHDYATSTCDELPIYDEFDDSYVESISFDAMLHRISCENSIGHIMFDNPLYLSYAIHEMNHIASLQSHCSSYAYAIKINPICEYGIDDKHMIIGICFSCDNIAMLPLHHLCNH